jgi:hypothetical protein
MKTKVNFPLPHEAIESALLAHEPWWEGPFDSCFPTVTGDAREY